VTRYTRLAAFRLNSVEKDLHFLVIEHLSEVDFTTQVGVRFD